MPLALPTPLLDGLDTLGDGRYGFKQALAQKDLESGCHVP